MDNFTASEMAYKNGFDKGFTGGEIEAIRKMLSFLEAQMVDKTQCKCGRRTMKSFYNYCPYCGEKY